MSVDFLRILAHMGVEARTTQYNKAKVRTLLYVKYLNTDENMKYKIIFATLLVAAILTGCDKKTEDDFLISLDNTQWMYRPHTAISMNMGSILSVDDYLIPTIDDAVTCWFYSDGTCDMHVQTATRGQTFHTTRWTCSTEGDVVIKKGTGVWMSGLFLGQKLTLNDGMVFTYCGTAKK